MDNDERKLIEENPINQRGTKSKRKPVKKTRPVKFKPTQDGSRKNLILVGVAILAVIIISALIFTTLTALFSTETYYVLNANVKAKQQITPDMVVMRETASGTGPVNALNMENIQRGQVYARYPLYAGDVIAYSNAGPLSGQTLGIPDDWSVTSFSTTSTDAVGGILGKGDYVDILGIDDDEGSRYIFNNLLILDVKFVNAEFDNNASGETIIGEVMHYTIGMPAKDVAYFHSALLKYGKEIKVVKAPYLLNYAKRDVSDLDAAFKYGPETGNIDLFLGTDPTFTEIERDETGKPLNIIDYNELHESPLVGAPELPIAEDEDEVENEVENNNEPIEIDIEEVIDND